LKIKIIHNSSHTNSFENRRKKVANPNPISPLFLVSQKNIEDKPPTYVTGGEIYFV